MVQNPRLPTLNLDVQKDIRFIVRPFKLTQGDKGYIQPFMLTNAWSQYSVSAANLSFHATKPDGTIIEIENEPNRFSQENGVWLFTLPDQIAQAIGNATCYFSVKDGKNLVASTTKFSYEIGARFGDDIPSNNYVSALELLEKQFQDYITNAQKQLNDYTKLNNDAHSQVSTLLTNLTNQVNSWIDDKKKSIDADIKKRQDTLNSLNSQYQAKYNELVAKWNEELGKINTDWSSTKKSITDQATAQRNTINQQWQAQLNDLEAKKNKTISDANATLNSKYKAIDTDWNNKKQALQSQIDKFADDLKKSIKPVSDSVNDLTNNRLPAMENKAKEVQTKVDKLRADMSAIDFSSYAKKEDIVSGGVNLLANTDTFEGWDNYGAKGQNIGFNIDPAGGYYKEAGYSLIRTQKVIHIWADKRRNALIRSNEAFYLQKGTYTLSFVARQNSTDNQNVPYQLSLFCNYTDAHNGNPLGFTEPLTNEWQKYKITFEIPENQRIQNFRFGQVDDHQVPGGSIYISNIKLETGPFATEWCRSDKDYYDKQTVDNKIASNTPSGTIITNYNIATKTPTKENNRYNQRWLVDQGVLAPFADAINNLQATGGNRTNSKVNLNTLSARAYAISSYILTNDENVNTPPFYTDKRGTLVVLNWDTNAITQLFFPVIDRNGFAMRTHLNGKWNDWRQIANVDYVTDVKNIANAALPKSGGDMNKGSTINWRGGGAVKTRDGNLGGLYWAGATDWINIFGDNNGDDNLDLVINLGDDNSNHISFRWNGAEKAAINSAGKFTGRMDWNNVDGKPNVATRTDINNVNNRINELQSKIPDIHTVNSESEGNSYLASHPNAIIFVKG